MYIVIHPTLVDVINPYYTGNNGNIEPKTIRECRAEVCELKTLAELEKFLASKEYDSSMRVFSATEMGVNIKKTVSVELRELPNVR